MQRVDRLNSLFALPGMGAERNASVCQKMDDFFNLCYYPDFQIAFVGTIKTGKSTLINALLGKNYASMAVTPETAALTKFRSSDQDYVRVTFYNQKEWEQLWDSRTSAADTFNEEYEALHAENFRKIWVDHIPYEIKLSSDEVEPELNKWSSSKHPEHYFVKEIEVGISTLPKDFPHQVVFVDTPGLSDPVGYRSDLTREYIRKANAVFVCVDAQKMQKEEIETISSVFSFSFHNKSKVHIIATHWDTMNNPDEDWAEQKRYLEEKLKRNAYFGDQELAKSNIMHSSAFLYNLCRDYNSLTKDEQKPLKKFAINYDYDLPDDLEAIKKKTNIDTIAKIIREKLADNYQKLLLGDIKAMYTDILYQLFRIVKERREEVDGLLKASIASDEEMEQMIQRRKERREKIQEVSNKLTNVMELMKEETDIRVKNICEKLRLSLNPKYRRTKQKSRANHIKNLLRK